MTSQNISMRPSALVLCILLLSCTTEKENPQHSYDSDAPVISNSEPSLGDNAWTLSEEASLVIGSAQGSDEFLLSRVFSAIQLDDKIIISNSGTHQLRFYDLNGNFLYQTGQQGRGPGDFGDYSSIRIQAIDSSIFLVNDGGNDRTQTFNTLGEHLSVQNYIRMEGFGNPGFRDLLSDGSHLYWSVVGSARIDGEPGDVLESEYAYHRITDGDTYDRVLIRVRPRRRYVNPIPGGGRHFPYIPLDPEPFTIADRSAGILHTKSDRPEVIRIDSAANIIGIYRWSFEQDRTEDIWDDFREDYLSDIPEDDMQRYENFLDEDLPLVEKVPALSDLMVDQVGNIWAKRYQLNDSEYQYWDVLDAQGQWITTAEFPPHIRITEIGNDYILGTSAQKGFTQVVKYDLLK